MARRRGRSARDAHAYIGVMGVLECLKSEVVGDEPLLAGVSTRARRVGREMS
jgi:hypothetical protein